MTMEIALLVALVANYIIAAIILFVDIEYPKEYRTIQTKTEFFALFIPYATLLVLCVRVIKHLIKALIEFYKELK